MKKLAFIGSFFLSLIIFMCGGISLLAVSAAEVTDEFDDFENMTYQMFGDIEINSCEYLHSTDNSLEFVYVDFEEDGYVIYDKNTMEMLEYSQTGDGPYSGITGNKYYDGPTKYYAEEDGFLNPIATIDSGAETSISQNGAPILDDRNLINAVPPATSNLGYITNAQYFVNNPTFGFNEHGTCGSVAAQLLLEYNNYYVDRRLIAPEHLNGDWSPVNGSDDKFDPGNYTNPARDPNVCSNPTTMTSNILGSNDDYYNYLINCIEPDAFECVDTVTRKVIDQSTGMTTITVTKEYPDGTIETISTETRPTQPDDQTPTPTQHSHNGSTASEVINGLEDVLSARFLKTDYEINHDKKSSGSIDSTAIKAEIDAGRPLIIGMSESIGGIEHWVVGYGYQSYTYPTAHPNAGETYSGYVVHFGWPNRTNIWVNESWCDEYISLELNHVHNLNVDTGNNIGNDQREIRCGECGYRTVNELYTLNSAGNMITGCNYDLEGQVTIPSQINGQTIIGIAANAFENQTGLTHITLPGTVTTIGSNAFNGCTSLTTVSGMYSLQSIGAEAFKNCQSLASITIPLTVTTIGERAFTGCSDLNITVSSINPDYAAEGNILYNKAKTKIIATGKIASELTILDSVTEIGTYAFAENSNLVSVRFSTTPAIGAYAFYHCANMNSVYFDSYNVPEVGENSFSNNNFVLYTRYNAQSAYQTVFSPYTNNIVSIPLQVLFISDGQVIETKTVYNGSTISNLPIPSKTGNEFEGWYPDSNYSGTPYQNGGLWESETVLYAYAKWSPNQYTVTLDANGGTLIGPSTFQVTYGNAYSTSAVANRTGYTLEGWYDSEDFRYLTPSGQGTILWDKAEDTTLYAHWTIEKYKIQINVDDDTVIWLGADGFSDTECAIEYGTVLSAINLVPTFKASEYGFKEGQIFDHFKYNGAMVNWTNVPDLGTDGTVITITPIWVFEEHTIYFNATYEIEVEEIVAEFDQPIDLPELDRTGYLLTGWYTSLSSEDPVTWQTMPDLTPTTQNDGSITLYAKWEPVTYKVVYNKNGGTGTMANSDHIYDEPKNLSWNLYSKTGYTFIGWATTAVGPVVYSNGQEVENLTADHLSTVTLYAVWQPNTYNIIYKNLISGMQVYPTTYTYGQGLATMPKIYTGSGTYTNELEHFYGWYTNSSFSTRVYSISKTATGDITLYAKYDFYIGTTYASYTHTVTDGSLENQPSFNVDLFLGTYYFNEFKNTTINKIKIEFSMNIWEQNDGYQDLYLLYNGTQIWGQTIEHGPGNKETTPSRYTFTIELNMYDYTTVDRMNLTFGAHGSLGDTWNFNDFEMSVFFTN